MLAFFRQIFGKKSAAKIEAAPRYGFEVEVDGADLVVRETPATWFGGANDPEDNGETASGISTIKRPEIKGCALPMDFGPCKGSPLPRIPWGTPVEVTYRGKTISVALIDLGPSLYTGNGIDLTQAAFCEFAPLAVGKIVVAYRIPNGARFLRP